MNDSATSSESSPEETIIPDRPMHKPLSSLGFVDSDKNQHIWSRKKGTDKSRRFRHVDGQLYEETIDLFTSPITAGDSSDVFDETGEKRVEHKIDDDRNKRPLRWNFLSKLSPRRDIDPLLVPLISVLERVSPEQDIEPVIRAYQTAAASHVEQFRKSGEPYITHPVAVAIILAELGITGSTLIAALLHDTVEDTPYTLEQLTADFGEEVALLVDGVTKIDKVTYGDAAEAETVRKMIMAMSQDLRVLLIKLADRIHNARTWSYVSSESSQKKARETLDIYAPLAHRLGMTTLKTELEDLSFATLQPKIFKELQKLVNTRAPQRTMNLEALSQEINQALEQAGIVGKIKARSKHYYSIYQKMMRQEKDFADIYDLVGLRIVVGSVSDCYAALGTMHALWPPIQGRFKDYISMPKYNLYQSLHTTVIGPTGKPVEIQIRTQEMEQQAEYGIAAHWKYKNKNSHIPFRSKNRSIEHEPVIENAPWLKSVMDWHNDTFDSQEFLDYLKSEINSGEVYAFTPTGQVITLPAGATPVDFAYAVHTEVGAAAIGARVNGKQVSLKNTLDQGDVVEILTSKAEDPSPSQDWLNFVVSSRAKTKIRQHFARQRRGEAIENGQFKLKAEATRHKIVVSQWLTEDILNSVAKEYNLVDAQALYAAIGSTHVSAEAVIDKINHLISDSQLDYQAPFGVVVPHTYGQAHKASDAGVIVDGVEDIMIKMARCCTPVPPEPIRGYVTIGSGVSIHSSHCGNLQNLLQNPERILNVEWKEEKSSTFVVEIQLEALDRKNLLTDVTQVLSDNHLSILSAKSHTSSERVAISRFAFEITDLNHLEHVIRSIRKVEGVYEVYRARNASNIHEL